MCGNLHLNIDVPTGVGALQLIFECIHMPLKCSAPTLSITVICTIFEVEVTEADWSLATDPEADWSLVTDPEADWSLVTDPEAD